MDVARVLPCLPVVLFMLLLCYLGNKLLYGLVGCVLLLPLLYHLLDLHTYYTLAFWVDVRREDRDVRLRSGYTRATFYVKVSLPHSEKDHRKALKRMAEQEMKKAGHTKVHYWEYQVVRESTLWSTTGPDLL